MFGGLFFYFYYFLIGLDWIWRLSCYWNGVC